VHSPPVSRHILYQKLALLPWNILISCIGFLILYSAAGRGAHFSLGFATDGAVYFGCRGYVGHQHSGYSVLVAAGVYHLWGNVDPVDQCGDLSFSGMGAKRWIDLYVFPFSPRN